VNTVPGSLPIQLETGAISEEVTVIEEVPQFRTSLTLAQDISSTDEAQFRSDIAAMYGVSPDSIELNFGGGSVVVSVAITAVTPELAASISDTMTTADATALSSVLGVVVTGVSAVSVRTVNTTKTIVVQKECPPGHWCSAGYTFVCDQGTYNPSVNADSSFACMRCPENAFTLDVASTSKRQCKANKPSTTTPLMTSFAARVRVGRSAWS